MVRRVTFLLVAVAVTVTLAFMLATAPTSWVGAAEHPIPPPLKEKPPSKFECRWTDAPLALDGTGSDPAWKNAETIRAFHLPWLGDKARLARTATAAKLLWDREYLYFYADMEDSDLFADITEHDGELWKNDVFELFFRPDAVKTGLLRVPGQRGRDDVRSVLPQVGLRGREREGQGEFQPPRQGEAARHAEQARRRGPRLERRRPDSLDRLRPHRRPARARRNLEAEPLPLRLPQGLEGAGTVVRGADRHARNSPPSSTRATTTPASPSLAPMPAPPSRSASTRSRR